MTNYTIPETVSINGKLTSFKNMKNIIEINAYLEVLERLQAYDPNMIISSRRS
jgi:hypothetical protein